MDIDALARFEATSTVVENYVVTADYGGQTFYLVDNLDDVSDADTYNSMLAKINEQDKSALPAGDSISNYDKYISEYK